MPGNAPPPNCNSAFAGDGEAYVLIMLVVLTHLHIATCVDLLG